ncbi:MAG: hypothetical protein ACRDSH_05670 [Pseudonocardiaceae bacterium]
MTFDDRVEVVTVQGGVHMSLDSAEHAQLVFSRCRTIRLVWTGPAATRQLEERVG